jgi:hypothetical protein
MSGLVSAIFGGNEPPPPPDYTAAAKETAAGNLDAARLATRANRINQVTPYGSLSYQEGPNDSWTQTMNLTPQAQATLDKQMRLSDQYADTASKGFANVQGLLENPNIDTSNIPQMRGIDMSQMSDVRRLNPMLSARSQGGQGNQGGMGRPQNDLMREQTQVLEQIPEYQQSMEIQRSLQGRQPTPEQQAQLTALSESISSNPALNQFQERARQQQMPSGPDQDGIRSLNSDMSGIRDLNNQGLNQVGGINFNALPQAPINAGQTAQDAIFSRLNPTLSRDDEALRTRLANQGIALGSSAYNREMDLAGQRANDLRLQAAAQGIGLDQAARQQSFGEQLSSGNFDLTRNNQAFGQRQAMTSADLIRNQQQFAQNQALTNTDMARNQQAFGQNQASSLFDLNLRNQQFNEQQNLAALSGNQRNQALQEAYARQSRPLDLVNALRSGAQVQNPQFQQFAQQATTQGPNMLGAAQSQYGAEMNAFNAQNAQTSGLLGGIAGVGLGLAGLPGAGGSISKGFSGLFS